ncbi:histidine kinase dimerization/phosphoacceptor domain -containing protein [Jiella pacifica]|uniref:histidine kinase n=1 Tax=Jiella pacifica TaxID=2696469 RepID=A0A6N9SW40_9HYPH|nr:histidine kinase dimerization/phosphoacceptor domain -containing protein [Jiella pacifica]NDW03287.1 hypothetical protein [Jiella pacifica]
MNGSTIASGRVAISPVSEGYDMASAGDGLASQILAQLDVEIMVTTPDGRVVYANPRAQIGAGLQPRAPALSSFADYWSIDDASDGNLLRRLAGSSSWQGMRLRRSGCCGADQAVALRGRGFLADTASGRAPHLMIMQDPGRGRQFEEHRQLIQKLNSELAYRRRMEQALKNLLAMQKRLHRELVHRVKNNLTLLISMVAVGRRRSSVPAAAEEFKQLEHRIMSLATIHELLDQEHETDHVAADKLLGRICTELQHSLVPPGVTLSFDLAPIRLHIYEATPLGLIVNELTTNAVKHAFPDGRSGRVSVSLVTQVDGSVCVTVADDGIGLGGAAAATRGSGSAIVRALAAQLNAELTRTEDAGTTWRVVFKRRRDDDAEEQGEFSPLSHHPTLTSW